MKPWQESWFEHDGDVWNGSDHIMSVRAPDCSDAEAAQRGRLAAAAPEMARLLLELQDGHCVPVGYDNHHACVFCDSPGPDVKHEQDCKLMAVLRKAGVAS